MSSAQGKTGKYSSKWIHCNRCFENYADKQRSIYILSCYDVACIKCIRIIDKEKIECLICKNIVKGHPIGNNMKSSLKDLFHPRPWSLKFVKTRQVLKFQTKQRQHFLIGCKKLKEYNQSLAKERDRVKEESKQLYLYREEIKKKKATLASASKKFIELMRNKYAYRGSEERHDHIIPDSCHMLSRSRNEDIDIGFSPETSPSSSFYL